MKIKNRFKVVLSKNSNKSKRGLFNYKISNVKIVFVSIFFILNIIFCSFIFLQIQENKNIVKQTEEYILETKKVNNDLKKNLKKKNEEYIDERLRKIVSIRELSLFAYNKWKYGLYINFDLIKDTGTLTIDKDDEIAIRETFKDSSLPRSTLVLGSLTRDDKYDKFENYISVMGKDYAIIEENDENTIIHSIKMGQLKSGDKFTIVLAPQLAHRMNFKNEKIKVTVA